MYVCESTEVCVEYTGATFTIELIDTVRYLRIHNLLTEYTEGGSFLEFSMIPKEGYECLSLIPTDTYSPNIKSITSKFNYFYGTSDNEVATVYSID